MTINSKISEFPFFGTFHAISVRPVSGSLTSSTMDAGTADPGPPDSRALYPPGAYSRKVPMKAFCLLLLACAMLGYFAGPTAAGLAFGLGMLSSVRVTGTGKRGRPKGSTGQRRSAQERMRDTVAKMRSQAYGLLRDAVNPDSPGYVPGLDSVAAGLLRMKRDTKRFTFYANPSLVDARIAALEDRIARIREVSALVQSGELKRSESVEAADKAFSVFSQAAVDAALSGDETNTADLFAAAFPAPLQNILRNYAETPDPFAGTEDESEDAEESESDDDDVNG